MAKPRKNLKVLVDAIEDVLDLAVHSGEQDFFLALEESY